MDSAGDLPPGDTKLPGVILNESDRMTHIVQDLLTLSRFDSGHSQLNLTTFLLRRRVGGHNAVRMEAQRHGHSLSLEGQRTCPASGPTGSGCSR